MPALSLTLPVRQLVEFLLRTGSIDNRFTGFDRALEGARLHRKLQKEAVAAHPDYSAEVSLRHTLTAAEVEYTIGGRADGIFTLLMGEKVGARGEYIEANAQKAMNLDY